MSMKQESNQTGLLLEPEVAQIHIPLKRKNKLPHQSKPKKQNGAYGVKSNAILMALEQYGAQSRAELEVTAGIDKNLISAIVSRLNKRTPRSGKQIHVTSYVFDAEGARRYPRAVYTVGDGVDVRKPKTSPLENRRRYEAKKKGMYRMNSVFNLGKTRDQVRAELRGVA